MMRRHMRMVDGYLLDVGPNWDRFTAEERAAICNGVGPSRWPEKVRSALNDALKVLLPGSRPHDIDYEVGGDEADRLDADRRIRANGIRVAKAMIGGVWVRYFTPSGRRRWAGDLALIEAAYIALRLGGAEAFHYSELATGE